MSKRSVSPTCSDVYEAKKTTFIKEDPDEELFAPRDGEEVEIVVNCHFQVKTLDPSKPNSFNFKNAGGGKETVRVKIGSQQLTRHALFCAIRDRSNPDEGKNGTVTADTQFRLVNYFGWFFG